METNRVITGRIYRYDPVPYDQIDPPVGVQLGILKAGDYVRVKKMPGCPPPNTMGMTYIATMGGEFAGMVFTNSLTKDRNYIEKVAA